MEAKLNPEPEPSASAEDFSHELIEFRAEVYDFLSTIAQRYSPDGIDSFSAAVEEFDNRLFLMAVGIKPDLEPSNYSHLISEVRVRKEVVIKHFDNPDTLTDVYSFERMIPRTTNFIRASMVGNRAISDEANNELKKLDDLHKGE